ncbi:MAG: caspase family protein [Flavobacteriales bacterium]|nr:caspase family protein [Flavobacteriales bacterium]
MFKRLIVCVLLLSVIEVDAQEKYPIETVLQQGHTKHMTAYDFSPNGKYLISGSLDNSLILWNVQTAKQIRSFTGHTEPIRSVVFSADGNFVLSASADNTAKVYRIINGELIQSIKLQKNELHQAYYSPDGTKIVLLDGRDGLWVYDTESGKKINEFKKDYGAFYERNLFDPNSKNILSKGGYKTVHLLDLESKDTLLNLPFDKAYQMAISPNGKTIAVSSTKLFTQVFNAETGTLMHELRNAGDQKCDGCNTHQAYSPDGNYLITGSNRVLPTVWNASNGKKVQSYGKEPETPVTLKINSTNDLVLISYSDEVFVYELKSGREKLHLESDEWGYFDFSFSPDGNYIAIPAENNAISVWNARSGRLHKKLKGYQNHDKTDGLQFSYSNWTHAGILKYLSLKKRLALSPDNQSVVVGNVDSVALQINLANGKIIQRFEGHSQAVIAFDFSPDGKVLATAGGDRKIILWDVESGKEIKRLYGHRELVFDLAFSSDGKQLLSAGWDAYMILWNLENETEQYVNLNNVSAYEVGFSPDDLYLVSGDLDKNVRFYEADAKESFRNLIGHTSIVSDFDFNSDGTLMATASWDGKLKVWDVLSGMLVGKMAEHKGQVYSLCFDPLNRFIASGGGDNEIHLWDYKDRKLLGTLSGHSTAVTALQITEDGKRLISASADGMIKVWDLELKKEIYSRMQINRNEWLATSPGGYFDGSSKALGVVNYVSGLESIKVSSLFDKYYSPDLINRLQQGESFDDRSEHLNKSIENSPTVSFLLSSTAKRALPLEKDSTYQWKTDLLPLNLRIDSKGMVLEEVRIYNNGKLIIRESLSEELVFRGGTKNVRSYEIPLSDGENEISAVVVNQDRTESEPESLSVSFDGEAAKTDLYILAIGINKYQNSAYNLDYAVNDAKGFTQALIKGADSLFQNTYEYSITNDKANKANILKTFEEIQEKIGPEDVFVFYYAGHGVMSQEIDKNESDFYIVTHDVVNLYGDVETLKEKALSATEILDCSMKTIATKQLFIIDACHSGGALESFASRGGAREKALAQLARSTGTFFLTASQDAQFANEVGSLKHGLFTYALLEALGGSQSASNDTKVTVNEMKSYVEDRVPELSEEYHGSAQYPTSYSYGQDFPLVILR